MSACCLGLTVVAGVVFGAIVLLLGEPLLGFFVDAPEAVSYGMLRMEVIVSTYFLCGIMEVGCGTLRGMGKTFLPMIVSLAGACGFRILWIFTIFQQIHTPTCLFLSYPISWVLTLAVHFYFVFRVKRQLEREHAAEQIPS